MTQSKKGQHESAEALSFSSALVIHAPYVVRDPFYPLIQSRAVEPTSEEQAKMQQMYAELKKHVAVKDITFIVTHDHLHLEVKTPDADVVMALLQRHNVDPCVCTIVKPREPQV